MAVLFNITHGWTGRLGPFTLRVDGTPLPLTGLTIELVLRRWAANGDSTPFTPGGTVVPDPDQVTNPGKVYYDPINTDFTWTPGIVVQQNYHIHWKVTDISGKVVFFPNGEADHIAVFQQ